MKKILALILVLPVYLTLLHTHEPELLKSEKETSLETYAVHFVHSVHSHDGHDHRSEEKTPDKDHGQSKHDCVICLLASSGNLANEASIEIPPERSQESALFAQGNHSVINSLFTRYFQRRGPPAPIVL